MCSADTTGANVAVAIFADKRVQSRNECLSINKHSLFLQLPSHVKTKRCAHFKNPKNVIRT